MTLRSTPQTTESASLNRRDFISVATRLVLGLASLIGLGEVLALLGHQSAPAAPTEFDLGSPKDYPIGSRTPLQEPGAMLLHTSGGFSALSLTCPHLGCQVNPEVDGFACPCHGSRFDPNGDLVRGPAKEPLRRLRVEVNDQGHLILYTS
jgi:cytochrome b6-f complex iron-sulfur subunit